MTYATYKITNKEFLIQCSDILADIITEEKETGYTQTLQLTRLYKDIMREIK